MGATTTIYRRGNVSIMGPGATEEFDSFMCCHCNKIVVVQASKSANVWSPPTELARIGSRPPPRKPGARVRGLCFTCMKPTCGSQKCARCIPFEARLEAMEGTRRFWKELQLVR